MGQQIAVRDIPPLTLVSPSQEQNATCSRVAFLSPFQERWLQHPRRRDRVTGYGLHHCTPHSPLGASLVWKRSPVQEACTALRHLWRDVVYQGVSKESATPAPVPRKSPRPPHLCGVPHRPLSALLAPRSLSQPPPGLLGAGSGVQGEPKLRMSRPSPEGAGPGRGRGFVKS